MNVVVIFVEGRFERASDEHPSLDEARSFACGLSEGAGYYGCGDFRAYVLPEDEVQMRDETEGLDEGALEKAFAAAGIAKDGR